MSKIKSCCTQLMFTFLNEENSTQLFQRCVQEKIFHLYENNNKLLDDVFNNLEKSLTYDDLPQMSILLKKLNHCAKLNRVQLLKHLEGIDLLNG